MIFIELLNNFILFLIKLDLWLSQSFIVPQKTPVKTDDQDTWKFAIKSLRDSSLTCVTFEREMMSIHSININICADIVQSLASYLNLDHIDVSYFIHSYIIYTYIFKNKLIHFLSTVFSRIP